MPRTLLLADDSVTIRRVIELTFTDENVRVVSVSSGREAIGPKQDDPFRARVLAIGPTQDDPLRSGALARPGDDNDPKASGGGTSPIVVQGGLKPIVVQGGIEAIGPKQDDPRAMAAIGAVARPGDDEDPQALACAGLTP